MAWTHVSGQCSLFSEIEATPMARRGAVSSHNLCWAGMRAVYARCCEDLGVDCSSVMPSTCSDECGSAAEMFFSHCQPFAYSHSPDTLGSVLSICRTQPHSLPGCTDAVAINFNPSATVDDGTCIVMQAPTPPPAPPRGAFPGCPYTYCCGGDQSSGWRANACNGDCLPVAAIFDNVCDEEFNCDIYQHDRNHCDPRPAQTPPPSPAAGPDGQWCDVDADQEESCSGFVSHCGTVDVRRRCPTTCAFGSYAPTCADPCRCSGNGLSGPDGVFAAGCGFHLPQLDPFCFVADPQNCEVGLPSSLLAAEVDSHAEWRYCDPTDEGATGALVPTCYDRVQNGEEQCIDGGGSCQPCGCAAGDVACLCQDGLLSPGEQMADCGGPCDRTCRCTFSVFGTGADSRSLYAIDGEYRRLPGTNTFQRIATADSMPVNVTWSAGLWLVTGTAGSVYSRAGPSGLPPACGWRRLPYQQVVQSMLPAFGPCDGDAPRCSACIDGSHSAGESGVDCGGPCDPCPSCWDGMRNQDETGVDCGGLHCDACAPRCSDGALSEGEERIDCGGACGDCPTCNDGLQNQGELGVDCGGPCPDVCGACQCTTTGRSAGIEVGYAGCATWQGSADPICYVVDPANCPVVRPSRSHPGTGWRWCDPATGGGLISCMDGFQGEGEEGVDCGGPCDACPTCSDGVQNGKEEQPDCGGECGACPISCSDGWRYLQSEHACLEVDEWCTQQWGPSWLEPSLDVCVCSEGFVWGSQNTGSDGRCVADSCTDGEWSPHEAGVDCGGPWCEPCSGR